MINQLLHEELAKPAYSGMNDAAILAALNAQTIEYMIQPETPELTNYLMNTGLYAKLIGVYRDHPAQQIRVAAECALDLAQSQIAVVNLENPNIQTMMNALVQGGVWTQAEADSVTNFAKRTRSRAEELIGREATEADVNAARLFPKWQQAHAAFNLHREGFDRAEQAMMKLAVGEDAEWAVEGG